MVYVRLLPYKQRSVAQRPFEKLVARYYGPFEVVNRIGQVAYRLKLSDSSKILPVFHVSQLRRAVGTLAVSPTIPEQLTADMELLVEPEQFLDVRRQGTKDSGHLKALFKWKGLPVFKATWEEVDAIQQRFPSFYLDDKVLGQGNVIHCTRSPQDLVTYKRRTPNDRLVNAGEKIQK